MDFIKSFFSLFQSTPEGSTGALRESVEDYRNISLGSFQKPVGAASLPDVRGDEAIIEQMQYFLDQKSTGSCVPHAIAKLFTMYVFKKTDTLVKVSRRWLYKLCKLADGYEGPGTYPRIGALAAVKDGFLTEDDLVENPEEGEQKYLSFEVTDEMRKKAKNLTFPGFAFADPTIEGIKEAIYQNGAVALGASIGRWNKLPLLSGLKNHYVIAYRVEDLPSNNPIYENDYKIYIDNSWGKGWLSKVKKWLFPGRGYFLWSEYEDSGKVFDIIAFTDIPADILKQAKKAPFKFTKELKKGMTDPQVIELQKFLNEEGFLVALIGTGSKGKEVPYFGNFTEQALILWQKSKGINPTGYFGPISIKEANKRLPSTSLIDAIIQVESGGNDYAQGDLHLVQKAYGPMQIRQPAVDDVNRRLGTSYRSKDCLGNRGLSILIFNTYCDIYQKNGSDENKARLWNGGPGGVLYPSRTDAYWAKVKKLLNK